MCRMTCRTLCSTPLKRFHWSCLYCRTRRFFYGKMDPKRYHYNKLMKLVIPNSQPIPYVLFIDPNRRNEKAKSILLKKVLTIAEMLAN